MRLSKLNNPRIFITLLFCTGLALCTFTLPVSLHAGLVNLAYFLLILGCGRWFARLSGFPGPDYPLLGMVLDTLAGLGTLQLLWFLAKWLHVHHLFLLVPAASAGFWWFRDRDKPVAPVPAAWRAPALMVLASVLLCLATTWLPFRNFGRLENGTYRYRASFWAVSLKHLTVINTLGAQEYPFENPYFKGKPFHYYYLAYSQPAALRETGVPTGEAFFLYHALIGYLFTLLCMTLFHLLLERLAMAIGLTVIFVCSVSVEGLYFFLARFGRFLREPLFFLDQFHLDAVSHVYFSPPAIDTLHRAIIFTPMHLLSLCFLLVALALLRFRRESWAPLFMTFSFLSSFFIGALGFIILGVYLICRWLSRDPAKGFLFSLIGIGLATLAFAKFTGMLVTGSGERIYLFFPPPVDLAWVIGLNFGLVLPCAVWGLFRGMRREQGRWSVFIALSLAVTVFLSFFTWISTLDSEVPVKLGLALQGLLIIAMLPLMTGKRIWILLAVVIGAGLPTYIGDVLTAADTRNPQATLHVPAEEMRMANWIARNLPKDAVIQAYPSAREGFYSLIPTFAERRTGLGDRMHGLAFQVTEAEYRERRDRVETALRSINTASAVRTLKDLGIGYIFYGERERTIMPVPEGLKTVRSLGRTTLYRVQ